MTLRVFAVDGARSLAHDPCTGLTHEIDEPGGAAGRALLDDAAVASWKIVSAGELDRSVPVSICWSPIVRCNLRCPHCLDDKSVPVESPARRREVAAIVARSGVLGVDISGGEPLLLPDLPALIDLLRSGASCAVSVTTNGWLLDRRAAELPGVVDAVRVSLDGPDAESHDRLRGEGSFGRALAGIEACVRLGIPLQVQTVLMASNRSRAQAMVHLASDLGARGLTLLQMLPIGQGTALAEREALTDDEARRIVADLDLPPGLRVRLRERGAADRFTVVRADGWVWRNGRAATRIRPHRRLLGPRDLTVDGRDGSA